MRFCVLASGSKGNALLVDADGRRVLVDCGLTPKVLRERLQYVGFELTDLHGLLITHAHGDHVAGALRLSGALRLPCYATQETQRQLSRRGGLPHFRVVVPGVGFQVAGIDVMATALPHDAPGTVAYVLEHRGERLGICTDLGRPEPHVAAALGGCDTLHLEFNHDEDMLWGGPYPQRLKQRVAGGLGHLSNRQAAELLSQIDTSRLKRLLLAHLSEVNNRPSLAMEAARQVLAGTGVRILTAPQYEATRWLD
ncbi:MAG: MBL fold metallo-hydrolase, partial [Myxococcota bacterium]